MIKCEVCGKEFKQITPAHLKMHGMAIKQYTEKYPNAPLFSQEIRDKIRLKKQQEHSARSDEDKEARRQHIIARKKIAKEAKKDHRLIHDPKEFIEGVITKHSSANGYFKELQKYTKLQEYLDTTYPNLEFKVQLAIEIHGQNNAYCGLGKLKKLKNIQEGFKQFCGARKYCACSRDAQSKMLQERQKDKEFKKRIRDGYKSAMISKYGAKNPMHVEEIRNKQEQTMLIKHGAKSPFESEDIQAKIKENNLKKYGVERPLQSQDIRDKGIETFKKNHPDATDQMELARKASYEKYNGNPFSDDEIKHQIKETMMALYGVSHPSQSKDLLKIRKKNEFEKSKRYNPSQRHISDESWNILINEEEFKRVYKEQGNALMVSRYLSIGYKAACRYCDLYGIEDFTRSRSQQEDCIAKFLDELGIAYERDSSFPFTGTNYSRYQVDFMIKDLNIAIEYCGLYYHSEKSSGRSWDFHKLKYDICASKNINLITIFSDEYEQNQLIVENIIRNKVGLSEKGPGARQCKIKEIDFNSSRDFLDEHHIMGTDPRNSVRLGLFLKDELQAVMTFKLKNSALTEYYLSRYSCRTQVIPGAFSKLLSYFKKNYSPSLIITLSDSRWSQGEVYLKNGFTFDKEFGPAYWYVKGYNTRIHRFNKRKKAIRKEFGLPESFEFKEQEFLLENGYDIIWDCGYKRFVWKKN